ncbi:flavin monoamine oxidase family protein [Flavisphingomonas formosensis]|uniref:flavin monoamine oxidase family protein n=1 Tax=Flavisphingomonas formosensis TaxID=861534 RepID=UPI0012F97844|nr:NAD(P)/FAD-dependent oxidoreductase [Sphingomonas formosensis]
MFERFDVAVIGAGAAGIAAARRLRRAGRSVIVLEAGQRIGGRACTLAVEGMALDMGCGWLHSADRNPFVALARENGFAVDRSASAWSEQYRDLGFPREDRQAANAAWDALEARLIRDPPASDRACDAVEPGSRWRPFLEALSGYVNGVGLDDLSVADYLAYSRAAGERNWRIPAGYGTLIASLLPTLPLHLSTPVTAIDIAGSGVKLATRRGEIVAKTAIVTVSTVVLVSGRIAFPSTMDDHLHAASQLPLGLADKLFFALEEGHGLEPETHLLGNPASGRTGSHYLMPFSRPVVESFFGGEGAEMLEREGLHGAADYAIDELAALLGSRIRDKLRLAAGTRWRRMDDIGGSYSHAMPGCASARAILARPVDARLFFAGEATHPSDFSTAHGAWTSGERAADEAISSLASARVGASATD